MLCKDLFVKCLNGNEKAVRARTMASVERLESSMFVDKAGRRTLLAIEFE